jgi:UDP-glucose 4-epimerase
MLVGSPERIRRVLGWTPRHDDLDFIVGTALAWEERLERETRKASVA